jgi:hypothetical protein
LIEPWVRKGAAELHLKLIKQPSPTSPGPQVVYITYHSRFTVTQESAVMLGVVMDSQLHFKEHIANAATEELPAAMAMRRLEIISPHTVRQLFKIIVAPVADFI